MRVFSIILIGIYSAYNSYAAVIHIGNAEISLTQVGTISEIPPNSLRVIDDGGRIFYAAALPAAVLCTGNYYSELGYAINCNECPDDSTGGMVNSENGGNTGCVCQNGIWDGNVCNTGGTVSCPVSFANVEECSSMGGQPWEGCVAGWNMCWRIDATSGVLSGYTIGNTQSDATICATSDPGAGYINCGFDIPIIR